MQGVCLFVLKHVAVIDAQGVSPFPCSFDLNFSTWYLTVLIVNLGKNLYKNKIPLKFVGCLLFVRYCDANTIVFISHKGRLRQILQNVLMLSFTLKQEDLELESTCLTYRPCIRNFPGLFKFSKIYLQ